MLESLYRELPIIFLIYCTIDVYFTKRLVREQIKLPFVGSPVALPRFILNLLFAGRAVELLQKGYNKVGAIMLDLLLNYQPVMSFD